MSSYEPQEIVKKLSLAEGMHVADFGAGVGYHALPLAEAVGNKGRVYAIDVQCELLDTLQSDAERKRLENIEILHRDLEEPNSTGLADNLLDAVLITNTLFQIQHKETVLKEAYRILKKDGRLLIVDWAWNSEKGKTITADSKLEECRQNIQLLATDVGFSLVREVDAGEGHYGVLLKK